MWSVKIETRSGVLPIGGDDSGVDATERLQSHLEKVYGETGPVAGAGMDGSLSVRLTIENNLIQAIRNAVKMFAYSVERALGPDVDARPFRVCADSLEGEYDDR